MTESLRDLFIPYTRKQNNIPAIMAEAPGRRFDIYQLRNSDPLLPFYYIATPRGTEVTISALREGRAPAAFVGVRPGGPDQIEGEGCSICQEEIGPRERFTTTVCEHNFHSRCIMTALQYGTRCPNCNRGLFGPW